MPAQQPEEQIRRRARELGFDDCRFTTAAAPESAERLKEWLLQGRNGQMAYLERNAAKRCDPQLVLSDAQSVITLAVSYSRPEGEKTNSQAEKAAAHEGVVARYARFSDYHEVLADKLAQLSRFVDETGGAGTRSLWYTDTGPILERDLAQRAGLGFIGKHTSLISRQLGNWFFIAEILTTLKLAPDAPEHNRCGSCRRCLEACPTGAIRAPFQLDARLCISYLTIELKGSIPEDLRPLIGNRIFGCDDCLAACPWNRFAQAGRLMEPHARAELSAPALLELLRLDEAAFKQKFAGTPLLRGKRRGLIRNVCVALGNTGDSSALPALEEAAQDPEPLVAEHAAWAIQRIKARH